MDSRRYQKRKTVKSGSACDPPLDMECEYLDNSSEPWEFEENLQFLEEAETLRVTDSSIVFENDFELEEAQASSSSYSFNNSASTKDPRRDSDRSDLEAELVKSVSKMVNIAERGKSSHSGFLGCISSMMDTFDSDDIAEFEGRIVEIGFEIRRRNKIKK
ncbi:uncharacterized protein LOC142225799 [Haematobia irritans]|uniref:uncharacterized protein LOC142225799 n=1 Tax=Haematobia irritans TaxID=7368 RepID=UPI003F4F8022